MTAYDLWLVQCGEVEHFPRGAVHALAPDSGTTRLPYGYVIARSADHVIAVDAGFDGDGSGRAYAQERGVMGWESPDRLLREIGIAPRDIDLVILTHAHWDHAGGIALFPRATVVMQERELLEWERLLQGPPQHRLLTEAIDPADIARLRALAERGRLQFASGSRAGLVPGVDLIEAHDTHTPGSQCVALQGIDRSTWVAAGDCVMAYANIDCSLGGAYSPISAVHGSRERLLDLYDRVLDLAGSVPRVIAVHEPQVGDRFGRDLLTAHAGLVHLTTSSLPGHD